MKRIIVTLALLIPLLAGCDDDPTVPVPDTFFSLLFAVNETASETLAYDVTFICSNSQEIPDVRIEGVGLKGWKIHEGNVLTATLEGMVYTDSVRIEINAAGRGSEAMFPLPTPIGEMTCNGETINSNDNIPQTSTYVFDWSCAASEHFKINWRVSYAVEDRESHFVEAETYQVPSTITIPHYPNWIRINLDVQATTGPMLTPGNEPNFSNSFGRGWVHGMHETSYSVTSADPHPFGGTIPGSGSMTTIESRIARLQALVNGID
ncbi:MAG: hypothetical protein GY835_11200 [bacterium]|nr:hypothetical protein [bacterium]